MRIRFSKSFHTRKNATVLVDLQGSNKKIKVKFILVYLKDGE